MRFFFLHARFISIIDIMSTVSSIVIAYSIVGVRVIHSSASAVSRGAFRVVALIDTSCSENRSGVGH